MDEQKEKEQKGGSGWCPWCMGYGHGQGQGPYHHHWHPGFFILRIVIAIIVIAFAFAVGVKLGELRSDIYYSGYGGSDYAPMQYMMNGYYGGTGYGPSYGGQYYGMPMMRYYYGPTSQVSPAVPMQPTQPAPTTTK